MCLGSSFPVRVASTHIRLRQDMRSIYGISGTAQITELDANRRRFVVFYRISANARSKVVLIATKWRSLPRL